MTETTTGVLRSDIAAVIIGRNEGDRLVRCLQALPEGLARIIYVDSGSTDGSVAAARAAGAEVVELDMSIPFTAARARNAGLACLGAEAGVQFVQVIDGDCELQDGWLETAGAFLRDNREVAVVAGRLRERFADATVWNRLADAEWAAAAGEADAVGGVALLRHAAVRTAGYYRADLVAGEEPELCLRLRRAGWKIWRLEAEMALHDIAMTRFGQWWRRAARNGRAIAEGASLHGRGDERYRVAETRRALIWGAAVPLVALAGAILTPWALLVLMAWPAQVLRLRLRGMGWERAFFLTLGKLLEAQGVLGYRARQLIRPADTS